ncbi:MAG: helix-turn-helix transcriptional regulator [Oscillospiraceae bacterium]|nr:helix-turn-helix transcriptional regulator [Oscillospiraceae bacterium]
MNYCYKNLKVIREKSGYTQAEIAHILQTRQEQYSKYELGKREIPVHHLITLSMLYGVSVDELLGLKKHSKKEQKF